MVVTWSKAGPLMHRACTSEEIVSGRKPLASMARAVLKANDPRPWPISNLTPRARASSTSRLTAPCGPTGALGKGRKAWVRMSPGLRRWITSS